MQKKILLASLFILLFPAMLIILSGDFAWVEGWIFSLWFLALCYSMIFYLSRQDPALLEERFKQPGTGNQQGWDRFVVAGLVLGFTIWTIVIPLDAIRFDWSPTFPILVEIAGFIILLGSFYLFFRSYVDNTYLSPLVRVQDDKGQQVVSTGVYGFVRHPMYLGGILMFLGAPLLMGSIIGILVGLVMTALLMARIVGEEALLTNDLAGYKEYKQKVRYRLFPYIW